jgi:serine/threonine protein kinase/regulation of enolase protein 1 (concanavalin A-like superfamily)
MTPFTPTSESISGGDAEIHPSTSSSLESCPHCAALVDVTEREPLQTISCPGCGQTLTVYPFIGNYQLIEVAGRGGMGVVYKAYDPSLDRHIAIKLLLERHSSDQRLIEQLEAEARMTASITDPHVVRVFGTGFDRGRFYIVMELVDQGSLDELIRTDTRVAEMRVLHIGIQIAKGLKAAQLLGLIHRDVKPGNILFSDVNTAKIVDFGLALFTSQIEEANAEIWGTPYYLAPEKLDGGAEDFRSDIYSLGGTLFHALAGRPPFEAETPSMVVLKHMKSQVVSLQAFAPWVSNSTAHIINKTLSKNPSDRYASYDEFIQNMEYAHEQLHEGNTASPSRTRLVMETDEDRTKWTWMVLGMAAVIVALLVGVFLMRPKTQPDRVVASASAPADAPKPSSFEKELTALISRDQQAAAMFEKFATSNSASPTDRAWALVFEGTAHLLAGREPEAKDTFGRVAPAANLMVDKELAEFLNRTSQQIAAQQVSPTVEVAKLRRRDYQAIGYFLHGLNTSLHGSPEDGTALLREFRATKPEEPYAWMINLKPLATILVEESITLAKEGEKLQKAHTTEARVAAAGALRKLGPAFAAKVEALIGPYANEIANYQEPARKAPASGKSSGQKKTSEQAKAREQAKSPKLETSDLLKASDLGEFPGPGVYRIVNKLTNQCLDVQSRSRTPKSQVVQMENNGGVSQMWEVIPGNDGTVGLRNVLSGLFLNLPNASLAPETQIQIWEESNAAAGKWRLEARESPWYFIRSAASNQVLGIFRMNSACGAPVTQRDKPGSADHFWRFERTGVRVGEWVSSDVGEVTAPGETELIGGILTMSAQTGDIWGTKDSFRYLFQEVVGDFDFSAHILEASRTHTFSKVGLMVRGGAVPRAASLLVLANPKKGGASQIRPDAGKPYTQVRHTFDPPCWLKVTRRGTTFTTYGSEDGVTWSQIASEAVPGIVDEATVGVAISSVNNQPFTAKVDQIKLAKP